MMDRVLIQRVVAETKTAVSFLSPNCYRFFFVLDYFQKIILGGNFASRSFSESSSYWKSSCCGPRFPKRGNEFIIHFLNLGFNFRV